MFGGNKDKQASTRTVTPGSASHNLLVKGTLVKGDIKAEADIRIDGTVEGSIVCDAKVIVGETGYIHGNITCRDAVVQGKIQGNIIVTDLLNLRSTAVLNGEIDTNKLVVEAGATYNGRCRMGKQNLKANAGGGLQKQVG